jgi:hypothetical protein
MGEFRMNKDVRAVVLGLFVIVVVAIGFSIWRRPAHEFKRIRGFKVEVRTTEGEETRKFDFNVPVSLLAQLSRLTRIDDALDGDIRAAWDREEITPRAILDAADESQPDQPGVIETDDAKIQVRSDGDAILIDVQDDWDHDVHVRVPRSLVEVFAADEPITTRDILRRLDELDPGDVVTIRDKHDEITITAQPRKGRVRVSWLEGFRDFPVRSFG